MYSSLLWGCVEALLLFILNADKRSQYASVVSSGWNCWCRIRHIQHAMISQVVNDESFESVWDEMSGRAGDFGTLLELIDVLIVFVLSECRGAF